MRTSFLRSLLRSLVLVPALAASTPPPAVAWGYATHRAIVEQAIETLPEPLRSGFRAHREEISDGSVEPDTVLAKRHGRKEKVKHFIDLDLYGEPPFAELPRERRDAVAKFGRHVVEQRGTVPWTIEEKHARLVRELREGNWRSAVRTAAYAGHYIADSTMPLHAVSDYDGQQSGSPGVHGAVEHELVDRRLRDYLRGVRAKGGVAKASGYSQGRVFEVLTESYREAPRLLAADRESRRAASFGSPAYLDALDARTHAMLAARIARAVDLLGAFWVAAWEQAGRPAPSAFWDAPASQDPRRGPDSSPVPDAMP